MSLNIKYDCKESFVRETKLAGNGGEIISHKYWLHVTLTLKTVPKFSKDKAIINDITKIDFNGSIYPFGGTSWENLDDKMNRKVQRIFDSGEPDSEDGRDKCISKSVIAELENSYCISKSKIAKLEKLGFKISSHNFAIDKNFKNCSEVTEL